MKYTKGMEKAFLVRVLTCFLDMTNSFPIALERYSALLRYFKVISTPYYTFNDNELFNN